jgi:UDP-N-acetylmuramoyl-L-alanyl-D-glutamate--2,6-diaminopimelate ligase
MMPARLVDLLADVAVVATNGRVSEVVVDDVTQESSLVRPGSLFCCRRGLKTDGHRYAVEAVERGASALLVERPQQLEIPQVVVADAARALPQVAAAAWGHPSRRLRLVGVTGTNGKTTTTYLLRTILTAHGWPTEVIGTLSGALTTPDPTELQRRLAEMVATGVEAAAMEVSSHGLVQRRVDATSFSVGVFTNLDRDHLDYHTDMASYFEAKASLFSAVRTSVGVVNSDDPWGARLLESSPTPVVAYTTAAASVRVGDSASTFRWQGRRVRLPLAGRFNVSNALAAATTAEALGVPADVVASALSTAVGPPGRMEVIDMGQPYRVVVDCAHTPSALRQVMHTLARRRAGRLIVVFGCGGDRDRTKRPEMGALVTRHADVGILTSDNPRTEAPDRIFADVLAGGPSLVVEFDRRAAIALAVGGARAGDTVLIAGKGNQTIQQIGSTGVPFDDRDVARQEIASVTPVGSREVSA